MAIGAGEVVTASILSIPLAAAKQNKEMQDQRIQEASITDSLLRLQQAEALKQKNQMIKGKRVAVNFLKCLL